MPGFLFWLFLPYHLLLNIFSIIWFSFRGQGKILLKAKADAFKALPIVWKKRVHIQASRRVSLSEIFRVMDKSPIPKLVDYLRRK